MRKKWTRKCFVGSCRSTGDSTPNKIFLCVPRSAERRRKWFAAVGKPFFGPSRSFYCCEDHFDLEADCRNWMFFKYMGGHVKLKKEVVPHKFVRQDNAKERDYSQLPNSDRQLRMEMTKKIKEDILLQKLEARNIIKTIDGDKVLVLPSANDVLSLVLPLERADKISLKDLAQGVSVKGQSDLNAASPELYFEVSDEHITISSLTELELELDFENDEKHKLTTNRVVLQRGVLSEQFQCQIDRPRIRTSTPPPDTLEDSLENNETPKKVEGCPGVRQEDIPDQFECGVDKSREQPSSTHPVRFHDANEAQASTSRSRSPEKMESPSEVYIKVEEDYEANGTQDTVELSHLVVKEEHIDDEPHTQSSSTHPDSCHNSRELTANIPSPASPQTKVSSSKNRKKRQSKPTTVHGPMIKGGYTVLDKRRKKGLIKRKEGANDTGDCDHHLGNPENEINIRLGYGHSEAEAIGIDPEDLEEHLLSQKASKCSGGINSPVTADGGLRSTERVDITPKWEPMDVEEESILACDVNERWVKRPSPTIHDGQRDRNDSYQLLRKFPKSPSENHRRSSPRISKKKKKKMRA